MPKTAKKADAETTLQCSRETRVKVKTCSMFGYCLFETRSRSDHGCFGKNAKLPAHHRNHVRFLISHLPEALLMQIEDFREENKQLGLTTKEDFLRDAARGRPRYLDRHYEHIEVLREKYEQPEEIIKETEMPFLGVAD